MVSKMGIADYYAEKSIFITGASGFMGKVLVEKLLRSCPDVKTLYLLIRPKKGQAPNERLQDFNNCKLFEKLREDAPEQFKKLHLISGDILVDGLGISNEDKEELQNKCQIVFHFAACVRFDIPLRDSVEENNFGTLRVMQLVEGMKKLEVFLYSSTSFCHDEVGIVEEKLYPSYYKPQDIMNVVRWMENDFLTTLEPMLLTRAQKPNVYALTKSLNESLVAQYEGKFPIAITRPSVVVAAYKEPLPGWIDNINGPTGISYARSRGVLHTLYCPRNIAADVVPVDMVVNGCIIQAYVTGMEQPKHIQVCNITQSGINPIKWVEGGVHWRRAVQEYPFSVSMWYPVSLEQNSKILHEITAVFAHWLPALFIDMLLYLTGRKPFLFQVQKRVNHGLKMLEYYNSKDWHFKNDDYKSFSTMLSKQDRETFYTDLTVLHWPTFITNYHKGIREYYAKEDPSTLPRARQTYKKLYVLHVTTMTIFYSLCIYFLYRFVLWFFSM